MSIVVGIASTNAAKLAAVQRSFRRMRVRYRLSPRSAPSGVSSQPLSENDTIQGAVNRATALIATGSFDLAIAFEGGVDRTLWGTFACEWCAVIDRSGAVGLGGGTKVLLPEAIAGRLYAGEELGAVADDIFSVAGSGAASGIFGLLTNELVTRANVHETALYLALARLLSASLYEPAADLTTVRLGSLIATAVRARARQREVPPPSAAPIQLSLLHS